MRGAASRADSSRPAGAEGGTSRGSPGRVVNLPGPPPQQRPPRPGATDDPVFAALREWRAGRARDDGVPAYVVAHDATLAAIAEDRPRTLSALRRVKGMGPAKLDRYGDEILAVLEATGG